MATQTRDAKHPNRPDHASDANVESGVEQTFPASDPVGFAQGQGSRAVPAEDMLHEKGSKPTPCDDGVTLSLRFPDSETAKLALEAAVHGPGHRPARAAAARSPPRRP